MKCPKCQFENREGVKFCEQCGAKMELECPKCGAKIPLGRKFCGECGHSLTFPSQPLPKDLSFDEKLDKIQRYLPKGLTEKILSQRYKIEGERKHVTVMFCDMEGFTHLSERLGPEEAYSVMDQVYEILIHRVHGYEGTVNEMTGDGIMALFGAPIALEDAPQRAIRSALAIHREMARFSDRIRKEREDVPPLKMRIGVHTGPVVVGTLGNDLRVEFKAVGDTVNLASRMEGLAEPGTTYVTEATFRRTEGLFRFEALGEKMVKGKEERVKAYRVIAPSTRRTRFDVSAERGLTPFVGREREFELLLDGFERSKAGRGQAFSIVSEAGVGKSRLLYECRKVIANEDVTFLEGKCLSYSRGVAYHLHIDILKANFDIRDDDGDSEIREKVKRGLKILRADEASTLPYLLELLSVKDSGIGKIPMSTEARKDRIIDALRQIVLKGSEIRPLILAYEDLHWVDRSSEDVLKYLLESIPGARVFLIFTYRPEFVHTWGGRSYHSQVNLKRLSNRESLAMAAHLLGTEDIERNLEDFILEKTEGVPFFIEEFIRSLKDLKIIERRDNRYRITKDIKDVTIPATIQDVIMARVDSLPETAKEVLQIGSVIEREFSYELLKRVTSISQEKLLSYLSILRDSELLYERGIYPQSTYIFKHALTQNVVYDSILTRRKKKLHEDVGNAIEELYENNIDEHHGVLAEHFIASGNYGKGAQYSKLAHEKALQSASVTYAIVYAKKTVTSLERLPQTDDVKKKIIDARTALGLYMFLMNYMLEAKEAVEPIIDEALKIGYKARLSLIYTIMGAYYSMVEEDFPKASKNLKEAIKISEEANDIVASLLSNYLLGLALSWNCEFDKTSYYIEKALDINVALNNLWGISVMKSILSFYVYNYQGMVSQGHQTSHQALQIAEESDDILSKATAYTCHGISCFYRGFFEEAEKYLLKGVNFSERINLFSFSVVGHQWLGYAYFDMEEYQKSQDHYCKAIHLRELSKLFPSTVNFSKIAVARTKVISNEKDIDLESLYSYANENKIKLYDGSTARHISEILMNIDEHHMTEAKSWINKAIKAHKRYGMMWDLAKDYALYGELSKRMGDQSKVKENLNKAKDIFKECGADGWAQQTERALSHL